MPQQEKHLPFFIGYGGKCWGFSVHAGMCLNREQRRLRQKHRSHQLGSGIIQGRIHYADRRRPSPKYGWMLGRYPQWTPLRHWSPSRANGSWRNQEVILQVLGLAFNCSFAQYYQWSFPPASLSMVSQNGSSKRIEEVWVSKSINLNECINKPLSSLLAVLKS